MTSQLKRKYQDILQLLAINAILRYTVYFGVPAIVIIVLVISWNTPAFQALPSYNDSLLGSHEIAIEAAKGASKSCIISILPKEVRDLRSHFINELQAGTTPSVSKALHLMKLSGTYTSLRPWSAVEDTTIPSLLLNMEASSSIFGNRVLFKTQHGFRYITQKHGTAVRADEAHRDQSLAAYGEAGIPLCFPIMSDGQIVGRLSEILSDSIAEFHLKQSELAWTGQAYAYYMTSRKSWENKYKETFSFNELTLELIQRPLSTASCGGAHQLTALLLLQKRDSQRRILSNPTRQQLDHFIDLSIKAIVDSQRSDGSWGLYWHQCAPLDGNPYVPDTLDSRFLVTGHLAEMLLLFADDITTEASSKRAAQWLEKRLAEMPLQTYSDNVCPCTHAFFVLDLTYGAFPR